MVISVLASSTLRFIRLRLAQVLSSKRFISLQRLCMCATLLTLSAATACLACPAHKTAPAGSTSSSKCCPAGASSPAGSSVCLQTYQIAHTPPEYSSGYAFAGVMQDAPPSYWLAPDRQNSQYAGGGDPSFYFVLDLGASRTVEKLVIRNSNLGGGGHYTTKTFSISMSIDSSTNDFGPQVTGTLAGQESSLQDVQVGLTGRYLKFKVLTYGHYSAGLKYVAVVVSV